MITELQTRLGEITSFKQIGAAADFQAANAANPASVPALFVLLINETGQPSNLNGRTRQRVTSTVSLVMVVRNIADAKGVAAGNDMTALRNQVLNKVLGWSPTPDHDPLQFVNGGLLALRDGHLWWQDSYRTGHSISSQ